MSVVRTATIDEITRPAADVMSGVRRHTNLIRRVVCAIEPTVAVSVDGSGVFSAEIGGIRVIGASSYIEDVVWLDLERHIRKRKPDAYDRIVRLVEVFDVAVTAEDWPGVADVFEEVDCAFD